MDIDKLNYGLNYGYPKYSGLSGISKNRFMDSHKSNYGYAENIIFEFPLFDFWISTVRYLNIHR